VETLTFQPVSDLVGLLRGADLRADEDPAKLNLPGAWVTVDTIRPLTVSGELELECSVFLIVGDKDYKRAYVKLAALYAKMATVLEPDGPVVPQGVVMPGTSTPLPALRVPVNLI
jgi:hypothetical protein